MKKTQFTDLKTTIRKTIVSFTAIVVFIALGIAFYGGTAWSVDHTEQAFTRTYQDGKMHTLIVTDPLGFTDSQVNEMKTIEGIDDAEKCNIVYRFFHCDGVRQQAAVWQITERTDLLLNVEGELPCTAGQTAVLRSWAEEHNIQIGDVIVLEDSNGSDYREMKPVRTVAQWDGESTESLSECLNTSECLAEKTLTVTAIADSPVYLSTNPYAHGTCADNGLYVNAVFFVTEDEIISEAFGGYTSVILYSKELNGINCFSDEYRERSNELCERVQNVVDEWDRKLVDDFGKSVDLFRDQLDEAAAEYGLVSSDGEILYTGLDKIRDELNGEESFCCVSEVNANNSYLTADSLIETVESLQSVLGITFLAVGVLVCYSVISRLVSDSAVQTGTRRALGFYRLDILKFYLLYVGAALLLGGIIGIILGVYVIEFALVEAYGSIFTLTELPLIFDIQDIFYVLMIVLAIIFAVTVISSIGTTRKRIVALLQGEQENRGDYTFLQKSRIFRKLPLLNQTVILNVLQDRERVAGMIIGIAGAATLMTAGISFYLNFTTAFENQFKEYYRFDYQICYDATSDNASQEIRKVLDRYDLKYAEIYSSIVLLDTPDGGTNTPVIIVPEDTEDLKEIMVFDTEEEKNAAFDSGVWIGEFYRYAFDAPVGSEINIQTLDGKKAYVPVDRYYKFHLTTQVIVMDSDTFVDNFGEDASPNAFYVDSNGIDIEELDSALQGIDGYIYIYDLYESNLSSFHSEKMVVTAFASLFILMAVIMALMIIINLINVYISEKKNELIILMINGYENKFAKRYIYQDTIVLTIIGILIGLVAGTFLGNQTLSAVEANTLRMQHGISWLGCMGASAAVAGMTAIICTHTLRRVDDLSLADINKM